MDQILIADDDNIDRKLLETYLQNLNYKVISTKNGTEAWEIISCCKNPPQIVIIDWLMPGMDGITLCKKIRNMISPYYVYIILVTAKSMSADMVQGLEAGADDYLTKPYEKAVLLARINVGTRILLLEREKNDQLLKIQSTNRKLQQNMEAAVQIQLTLLPQKKLVVQGYQFDWFFKPSDMLGGDMLHIYKLSETKVACYVLDVSGHGTQAALLSVTIRNQLTVNLIDTIPVRNHSSLILQDFQNAKPIDIVSELSSHYSGLLEKTGYYFTIVYGIIDIETGCFDYISAGHYNPILISGEKVIYNRSSSGAPIGMFGNQKYQEQSIQLSEGDRLYLFTDGIVEETNNSEEQYGLDRLGEQLKVKEINNTEGFSSMIEHLAGWSQKDSFNDDIALVEICSLKS
ncbi:SpoIIE family protein phosphatase [bacterium]|nr:SpoIIE family protein phosphatase [bacterium]